VLVLPGAGIVAEVGRRWWWGSEPMGSVMMAYSVVSFAVNVYVLTLLTRYRRGEVHLRASYICTRADVIANLAVFISGGIVALTGLRLADLIVGGDRRLCAERGGRNPARSKRSCRGSQAIGIVRGHNIIGFESAVQFDISLSHPDFYCSATDFAALRLVALIGDAERSRWMIGVCRLEAPARTNECGLPHKSSMVLPHSDRDDNA
jgi:hypothetical protein